MADYQAIREVADRIFHDCKVRYGGYGPNVATCHIAHMLDLMGIKGKKPRSFDKQPRTKACKQKQVLILYDTFERLGIKGIGFASVVRNTMRASGTPASMIPSEGQIAFVLHRFASKISILCMGINPEPCSDQQINSIRAVFNKLQVPYTG